MTTSPAALAEALGRLDADIQAAEQRLIELRARRAGIDSFIADYLPAASSDVKNGTLIFTEVPIPSTRKVGSGASATVEKVLLHHGFGDFTTPQLHAQQLADGYGLTREQVSNGVVYLRRRKPPLVEKRPGRGNWRVISTADKDGPAAAEPSERLSSPIAAGAEAG